MKIKPKDTLLSEDIRGIMFQIRSERIIATAGPIKKSDGLPTEVVTLSLVNNLIASLKG